MNLAERRFIEYLRENEGEEYNVEGTIFHFLLTGASADEIPKSIRFSSDQWSPTTRRSASARRIKMFLDVFNEDSSLNWREYRNRDGIGSTATTAKYLVHLMRKAAEHSDSP